MNEPTQTENTSITPMVCEWNETFSNKGNIPTHAAYHHCVKNHSFKNLKVLNLNKDADITSCIAHTAESVSSTIDPIQYDLITALRLALDKNDLRKSLYHTRQAIKPCGELFGTIRTQTNGLSLKESTLKNLLAQFCKKTKYNVPMCTDDEVKQQIKEMGYEIISYAPQHYNIIIKDVPLFESQLQSSIIPLLEELNILTINKQDFCNTFAKLIMTQLKKDDHDNILYPFNFTKMHLRKTKSETFKFFNLDSSNKEMHQAGMYV